MISVENNMILITQGDTLQLDVNLKNADGTEYTIPTNSKMYFYLRKTYNSVLYVIDPIQINNKVLVVDYNLMCDLEPRDYVYDIRVEGNQIMTPLSGILRVLPAAKMNE